MPKELWLGNVPLSLSEGMIAMHFCNIGLPVPYKCVVRVSQGNGQSKWAIATWQTEDEATTVMTQIGLKWPDNKFMVVRLVWRGCGGWGVEIQGVSVFAQ